MQPPSFRDLLAACVLALTPATPLATSAAPVPFEFSLDRDCTTSAGVYAADGRLVRRLWGLKKLAAGAGRDQWDGLDDLGRNVPPGAYEVRMACSDATFADVGTLGNSGAGTPMQAGTDDLIADRSTGEIYTADNWEEAGQDFRKIDADGRHLMDARFQVRNGNPNGWPIAVALDGGVLYCSVFTIHEKLPGEAKTFDGGAVLRKFSADKGDPIPFPTPGGYVRVKLPDPNEKSVFDHQSLHAIAVSGDSVVAADRDTGTVYRFDKNTGQPLGQFHLDSPVCVVADRAGRLWIAHSHNKVTVTDPEGKRIAEPEVPAGQITCIRLDREGRLWVADQEAGRVQVYKVDSPEKPAKLTRVQTYGHKAAPGEFGPLAVGRIQSFDVMPDGGFVLAQSYGHGSVVTRFSPDSRPDGAAVVWQQVGLEFCTNGTYDQRQPDLFISSLSNAYRLLDPDKGAWQFEGCLYQGPLKLEQSTGTPRIIERDGRRYFYTLTGEQVKVFRYDDHKLVPSALVGLSVTPRSWDPKLLGELPEKDRPTHYAWHDANGDGQIQPEEVDRVTDPKAPVPTFSCEVDARGNLVFPDHQTGTIDGLPLEKFDGHGNPVYDWSARRTLLPRDDSLRKLVPQKACPLPGGGMYVLQTAERSVYPPNAKETGFGSPADVCWMGGWVLSKYDRGGDRLFTFPLPDVCTGMDFVPNVGRTEERGVVVGCYNAEQLYHYSPDGLLLQILSPRHKTGWLDHNGSISINRNPRDGLVDVFAEESLCNRISWYRLDDRGVKALKIAVKKEPVAGEAYADEARFDALLREGDAEAKAGHYPQAAEAFRKALDAAAEAEKPAVHYRLGKAYESDRQPGEAVRQYQLVADAPRYEPRGKAEVLLAMSRALRQEKKYDEAVAQLERLAGMKLPADYHYTPRAMMEIASIRAAEDKTDEALRELRKVKDFFGSSKAPNPDLYRQAFDSTGDLLRKQKKFDEAIEEYEQGGRVKGVDANGRLHSDLLVGECYQSLNDFARAADRFTAAAETHPEAEARLRAEALLRAADCRRRAGDKEAARRLCQQVRDAPGADAGQKKSAEQKLEQWAK